MFKIIDTIIVIAMVWAGYKGIKKGFIFELFSILALIIGGWCAVSFSNVTSNLIGADSEVMHLVATAITFFATMILILLVGKIVCKTVSIIIPEVFDKILGFVFGVFKVLLSVGILFYYIVSVDVTEKIMTAEAKKEIKMYQPAYAVADFLLPKIKYFSEEISKNKEKMQSFLEE